MNYFIKRSTKCETVPEIQGNQVVKLWNNDHIQYHRIRRFRKKVATYDRWGYAVSQFVEALSYKPEGRGLDSLCCHH